MSDYIDKLERVIAHDRRVDHRELERAEDEAAKAFMDGKPCEVDSEMLLAVIRELRRLRAQTIT